MQTLIVKYRSKGILLDSNLLVLLVVGSLDPRRIETFKRTRNRGFTEHDFLLLREIAASVSMMVTTPYILAETSNFICEFEDKLRVSALQIVATMVRAFKERRPESKKLVESAHFPRFGLTDTAILDLRPQKHLVLSVDAALVIALGKKGVDAINFNHLRQLNWQQ